MPKAKFNISERVLIIKLYKTNLKSKYRRVLKNGMVVDFFFTKGIKRHKGKVKVVEEYRYLLHYNSGGKEGFREFWESELEKK